MATRTRLLLVVLAALSGLVVALLGAVSLLVPEAIPLAPSLLAGVLGGPFAAVLGLASGLAALAVAALAGIAVRSGSRAIPRGLLRGVALGTAVLLAALIPGGVVPVAGYAFVLVALGGAMVALVLFAVRRPILGGAVLLVVAGGAVLVVLRLPVAEVVPTILGGLGERLPFIGAAGAHLVAAATLAAWALDDEEGATGRADRWVLRHRRGLAIAAALCALPYAVARASWLTPWPLLGPADPAAHPAILLTGLLLGSAMLIAGLLCLLLGTRWADRFPRGLGGIGGRPVPPVLAVLPASAVAMLFLPGGIDLVRSVASGATGPLDPVIVALVLPFTLWGVLLLLATRGYALHRVRSGGRGSVVVAGIPATDRRRPSRAERAAALARRERAAWELEMLEEKDPAPLP